MERIHPADYLAAWSWHWLLPFAFIAGIYAAIPGFRKSPARDQKARFLAVFAIVMIVLNVLSAADVTFASNALTDANFGQSSRYYLMMAGPLAVAVAWLSSRKSAASRAGVAVVGLLCIASFTDYMRIAPRVTGTREATSRKLDQLISEYLSADSGNRVVCARTVLPERCAVLYAFNNYRSDESLAELSRKTIENGRIIYRNGVTPPGSGAVMIIREPSSPPSPNTRLFWSNELIAVDVSDAR